MNSRQIWYNSYITAKECEVAMRQIQWYPGHMAKAKRELGQFVPYLDIVLEVRDARLPLISHNADLDSLLARKPRLVILNKSDLADPVANQAWMKWFEASGQPAVIINGQSGEGVAEIWKAMKRICPPNPKKPSLKAGVVGIPNVGKSSLLNRLIGAASARTGNMPGVTRGKQWVRSHGFEILDTPGLLPPKIASETDGMLLGFIGTIREEIIPVYDLVLALIEQYGGLLKLDEPGPEPGCPEEILGRYAKKRGFLVKGGEPDLERAALTILREFRDGKLGRMTLEQPPAL